MTRDDDGPQRLTGGLAARAMGFIREPGPPPPRLDELPTDPPPPLDLAAEVAAAIAGARWQRWREQVPARFHQASLIDYVGNAPVLGLLDRWLTVWHDGVNLVLTGPVGTGKTHAGFAVARPLYEAGEQVVFWPAKEFSHALDWKVDGHRATLEEACTCTLLMVDDLSSEPASDWMRSHWEDVLNRRWYDNLPTIVTTNSTGDQLCEHIGERAYSRLTGAVVGVALRGTDKRRDRP